jgi:hypothetical protein
MFEVLGQTTPSQLTFDEFVVLTTFLHKIVVSPFFHQLSTSNDKDTVSVPDRLQLVCNHNDGAEVK